MIGSLLISGGLVISILASTFAAEAIPVPGKGINEAFTKPTKEQIQEEKVKATEAQEYVKNKFADKKNTQNSGTVTVQSVITSGSSKYNNVGLFRQTLPYSCGPVSARNLINGFVYYNRYGSVPTEATLIKELGTTAAGTNFDGTVWRTVLWKYAPGNSYTVTWASASNWYEGLRTRVITTIDKSVNVPGLGTAKNYNVIADLYHGVTSTPIHSVYAKGAAHYVCVYGYDDTAKVYYIADSNGAAPVKYTTPYKNLTTSTQARGIIW